MEDKSIWRKKNKDNFFLSSTSGLKQFNFHLKKINRVEILGYRNNNKNSYNYNFQKRAEKNYYCFNHNKEEYKIK